MGVEELLARKGLVASATSGRESMAAVEMFSALPLITRTLEKDCFVEI